MGSQSKINLAYIAGFLDGDGSVMLQIKKRKDGKRKLRFMATICFYQDARHEAPLHWIRHVLGIGYVSRRNDGMSELRINGFKQVGKILKMLLPYTRFKAKQVAALCGACKVLSRGDVNTLSNAHLKSIVGSILTIQHENYSTRRKRTREELYTALDLTP